MGSDTDEHRRKADAAPANHPAASSVPCHDVHDLMAGGQMAMIRLDDALYTLRITRSGKLILTK